MKYKLKFPNIKLVALLLTFVLIFTIANINTTVVSANTKYGRLTGINWFGFETGNYVVHGLWSRDYKSILQQIKDLGFNCVRIPWCYQMLDKSPASIQINAYGVDAYTHQAGLNLDLAGLSSLQVMDKIIDYANTVGLKIILDLHSLAADQYASEPLWYTNAYSESNWINGWTTLVTRYKDRANVIGADLKNEPHGNTGTGYKPPATWGYTATGYSNTDWKAAAERCAKAILDINPNLLIIVEGIEQSRDGTGYWQGGNLKDVKNYPIISIPKENLIYSFHEYGSEVFNQTWFSNIYFPNNMAAIWDDYFYFVQKQNIAPLFLGEFGITEANAANPSSIDYKWFTTLMAYLGKEVSWTFWSLNPNSGDTGGILKDDWVTVNTAKYNLLKPYLAEGAVSTPTPTQTPLITPIPTPVTTCSVSYIIQNDWGSGATISVTIKNNSSIAINGWTLAWTFLDNQEISNLWSGSFNQNGAVVLVKDSGFNANITANGGVVSFGFNLMYSGSNTKPVSFIVNGIPCQIQ